jgi:hypothetical protein
MKKTTYTMIVILTLLLTACGAARSTSPASGPQGRPKLALPATTQLIIGTLKPKGPPRQ